MLESLRVSPVVLIAFGVFAGLIAALVLLGKVPISYNIRNLRVRWRVTIMTALAFTSVVALMVVMLAFVNGMYKLTESSGKADNVIILADGATDEQFSNLGFGEIKEIELHSGVKRDDEGKPLASWEIYVVSSQPLPKPTPGGSKRRFVQIRGIDDPARSGAVHGVGLKPGGVWFSPAGVQTLEDGSSVLQAVLGSGMARVLGEDAASAPLVHGDKFELGGRMWIVSGVMDSAGSTFDSEVWSKRDLIGSLFGKTTYSTVVLKAPDAAAAIDLAKDLSAHFKKPAVNAQTEVAYYSQLNETGKTFLYVFMFVAAIMAIGGVFGVLNTMFAAVSQRTKDIGVLRIIGFARWQVLTSFFLEAMLLAIIGGLVGCLIGFLSNGMTMESVVGGGQGSGKTVVLKLVVDANILLQGLLLSLGMGFIGGLLPALSAMRTRPLESLR